jgi:phenylpropionate dioxygenase-like ring-hydroxylating dioxygenase large terminal subunit
MVLFRDQHGTASALLDRCPHRNAPLSAGRVLEQGTLECAYHGWQFDRTGACRVVPGLCDGAEDRGRRAPAFETVEQHGFVWVYPTADVRPETEPYALRLVGAAGYTTVLREVQTQATLHATVENALDVPHTAYLHRGLFRGGKKNEIRAIVRRYVDRVEAEYIGEPRPGGVAGRVLSPSGGVVEHTDRFILPSVVEVEYRLGLESHFLVTSLCTPVSDFQTRMFAVISFKLPIPGFLVRLVLQPFAMRIFLQDAAVLRLQADNIRRFGGEQFMSTEIDFLGPHIWRLLKQAESGERPKSEEPVVEREVTFLA